MREAKKRIRNKGRGNGGHRPFGMIPHELQDSENWRDCGGTAIKLLCALVRQYNGNNNGDLSASIRLMRDRGWRSADTLHWAMKELEHFGFVVVTRKGGQNTTGLCAITWRPINDCGGKHDYSATLRPPDDWKVPKGPFQRPRKGAKSSPQSGAARYGIRSSDVSKAA